MEDAKKREMAEDLARAEQMQAAGDFGGVLLLVLRVLRAILGLDSMAQPGSGGGGETETNTSP